MTHCARASWSGLARPTPTRRHPIARPGAGAGRRHSRASLASRRSGTSAGLERRGARARDEVDRGRTSIDATRNRQRRKRHRPRRRSGRSLSGSGSRSLLPLSHPRLSGRRGARLREWCRHHDPRQALPWPVTAWQMARGSKPNPSDRACAPAGGSRAAQRAGTPALSAAQARGSERAAAARTMRHLSYLLELEACAGRWLTIVATCWSCSPTSSSHVARLSR